MTDDTNFDLCICRSIMDADLLGRYDKSDSIYHYTSTEGILGILREDGISLWFSQYDSLNDMTEGTHVVSVYQEVCDDLVKNGQIEDRFYRAIYDIKPMDKEMFLYSKEYLPAGQCSTEVVDRCKFEEIQKYVCCFSKNRDSLPMWNYYTKGDRYEGYNIGVCLWRTQHSGVQDYYGKGYSLDFFTVIYSDEYKRKILRDKIEEIHTFYTDDMGENDLSRIRDALKSYLKNLSLKFKQQCFEHEQEVRAILTISKESPLYKDKFKVKYRSKAGYVIPYIEVNFPKEIVSGITIGPLLNDKTAADNIRQLAKSRGYLISDKDIKGSEIPVRY